MQVTADMLRRAGACAEQVDVFEQEWPDGAEVTLENAQQAAALRLDFEWFVYELFTDAARIAYNSALAAPLAAYRGVLAAAFATFTEAADAAQAVYAKAVDAAAAATWEDLAALRAAAQADYDKAWNAARAVYDETRDAAWDALYKAYGVAFFETFELKVASAGPA